MCSRRCRLQLYMQCMYLNIAHNKNPHHNIFAKGWVAQKNMLDRYLGGCAKIFQDVQRVGSENTGIF